MKTKREINDTMYVSSYDSPLGKITLASDSSALTGLWFDGQKHFVQSLLKECEAQESSVIMKAKEWLDIYFSGKEPSFNVPVELNGTIFQNEVWEILRTIPYGKTISYGEIAKRLAKQRGIERFSAQAVGCAVGCNRISIIVPCHRAIGADGSLVGYAGGIERKMKLLDIERCGQNV